MVEDCALLGYSVSFSEGDVAPAPLVERAANAFNKKKTITVFLTFMLPTITCVSGAGPQRDVLGPPKVAIGGAGRVVAVEDGAGGRIPELYFFKKGNLS